jgi:hypothetical protein
VSSGVPSLAVLVLLASCSTSPSAPRPVGLAERFTLAPGQTAQVEGTGLHVTFESVSADSRCPVDVTCVWEGDAVVIVSVQATGSARVQHELHTSGRYPTEADAGDYHVRLVEVAPVPRSGAPPAPGDYRVTLLVSRR